MFQAPQINPALADLSEIFKAPHTAVDAFIVSDGESRAVRLVLRDGGIELVLDVEAQVSPDGSNCHLDPYLTGDSRRDLMHRDLLSADRFDEMEQCSRLALEIAAAHGERIVETVRSIAVD